MLDTNNGFYLSFKRQCLIRDGAKQAGFNSKYFGSYLMRLHRYLLTQYTTTSLVVLTSLLMIVWLNQTLQLLELVVNKGAPLSNFLILSVLALPLWLLQAIPIALFIAIIWVFQKIQSDRELIVIQSVGWSPRQLAIAPLVLGGIFTAFLIFNSLILLPIGFGEFKERQINLRNAIPKILLQDKVFVDLAPDLTIFINERVTSKEVTNVFIQDKRQADTVTTLTAEKGFFTLEGGQPILVLENGERSELRDGNKASAVLFFEKYKLNFSRKILETGSRLPDMNEDSITNLLDPTKAAAEKYARQRMAYGHYRITAPFLALTMTLIALAGLNAGRSRDENGRKRLWLTISAALLVQLLYVSARSLTVSLPAFWPAQYISLLIPSAMAVALLFEPQRFIKTGMVRS